jgi:signal peptidase I
MNFDFEKILLCLLTLAAIVVFFAQVLVPILQRYRFLTSNPDPSKKKNIVHHVVAVMRSCLPVLFIVTVFRSFVFEPFRIPSSSMAPTLLQGDFILTNKFIYGLKLPVWRNQIWQGSQPQRGDVIVFHWPPNQHYYFIKRIVAVPGDHLSYIKKNLIINGHRLPQKLPAHTISHGLTRYQENLVGLNHDIYLDYTKNVNNYYNITVPPGMYFVMGDNRDHSGDSRYWGFVPEENIVGKAVVVWLSWASDASAMSDKIRWHRMAQVIH